MKSLQDLIERTQEKPIKTVALACPEDFDVLMSVLKARELNLCNFILFGDEFVILNKIKEMNEEIDFGIKIVNLTNKEEACCEAVKCVSSGQADVLMKGLVDTSVILKAVLNKEYGLRTDTTLSHVMIVELPLFDRLIFLSDGGMNIEPNVEQLKQITLNAIYLAHSLEINRPKVALLSAVEKVNPKILSTLKCQAIYEMHLRGEITGCDLLGPLSVDIALDENSAKIKNINNPVAGNADILITPSLEVANALYKGWMFGCANIKSAGVIVGAKAPIVLPSRSDTYQSKLYSLALSVLM